MICWFKKSINLVFVIHLVLVVLIALEIIPRYFSFLILALDLAFILFRPLEDSLLLLARLIPFFIALPLTANFDNFNMWRLVVGVLFLKWFFLKTYQLKISRLNFLEVKEYLWENKEEMVVILLFLISILSVFKANDISAAAKRIIYFINLGLLYLVVKNMLAQNSRLIKDILGSFLFGAGAVAIIGVLQLVSAFALPFDVFHYFWAKQIQFGFFGKNWSEIVFHANTWYSYSGAFLRLRMFSVFPDSHSFPIYLIFGLISAFALFFEKTGENITDKLSDLWRSHKSFFIKQSWLFFLLGFAIIFSQTRGIWLSLLVPIGWAVFFILKKINPYTSGGVGIKSLFFSKILGLFLLSFILIFIINYALLILPQFKVVSSGSGSAFLQRLLSIVDRGEISNLGRIEIWKSSFNSILKNPALGVGIGNFPVALDQSVGLAKAGSSAHNLFLTVVVELGIFGGILFLIFWWLILKDAWLIFKKSSSFQKKAFGFFAAVFILWILSYSMTDAALFDERAFLGLMVILGVLGGTKKLVLKEI
ncbi:MAG: hypothetical protein A2174_02675 [Candidatus Portnoybacteria bacterium RBG_13_41_18]|uniref:O-antigen ligase-related domain-containing protein n=1 Tax=Candidatus Portnoybacteria bacterium RBG_13_41_18 TaxID=1801991 RepID=A0A1G2F9E0_9BACT|nr:MAG: hypothetical protein A2174_02675 [Candidatus Portnoybacteria bacterium RBG_13_41_18]